MDGSPVDEAQAFDETQKLFLHIPDTMLKCAGLIHTNEEEYDACIDVLFKFMILGRAMKSIDGLEIAVRRSSDAMLLHFVSSPPLYMLILLFHI